MRSMKLRDVLVVGVAVLAGCSGGGSEAPPVESTSGTVTTPAASASGTSASPSASQSVAPSQDPLYLEAVEVYKKVYGQEYRLLVAGGAADLPPALKKLLVDPALTELQETYADVHKDEVAFAPTPRPIHKILPYPGVSREGSVVALRTCEDSRAVKVLHRGKPIENGMLIERRVYFTREAGSLRVKVIDAREVTKCDGMS